jgi:hypothetical protein
MKPEQVKVAITRSDGGVTIMAFVTKGFNPDGTVQFEREASAANVNAEIAKARLDSASWRVVPDNEVPGDRTFRGAWRGGASISVDMPAAREIWRDKLRADRTPHLTDLDGQYQQALELKNTSQQAVIAAKRQALRNVTADARITAASTPEALKALPDLVAEALNATPGAVTPEPAVLLLAPATIATFGSVPGAAISFQNLTVPGLLASDIIVRAWFSADFAPTTVTYEAERAAGNNSLRMRFQKTSTGSVTPTANQVLNVLVRR